MSHKFVPQAAVDSQHCVRPVAGNQVVAIAYCILSPSNQLMVSQVMD